MTGLFDFVSPNLQLIVDRNPLDRASYLSLIEVICGSFASSEQQDGNITKFVALLTTLSANAGIREIIRRLVTVHLNIYGPDSNIF